MQAPVAGLPAEYGPAVSSLGSAGMEPSTRDLSSLEQYPGFSAPGPRVAVRWMWADALVTAVALWNPLRWSKRQSAESAIVELEAYLETADAARPLKLELTGWPQEAKTPVVMTVEDVTKAIIFFENLVAGHRGPASEVVEGAASADLATTLGARSIFPTLQGAKMVNMLHPAKTAETFSGLAAKVLQDASTSATRSAAAVRDAALAVRNLTGGVSNTDTGVTRPPGTAAPEVQTILERPGTVPQHLCAPATAPNLGGLEFSDHFSFSGPVAASSLGYSVSCGSTSGISPLNSTVGSVTRQISTETIAALQTQIRLQQHQIATLEEQLVQPPLESTTRFSWDQAASQSVPVHSSPEASMQTQIRLQQHGIATRADQLVQPPLDSTSRFSWNQAASRSAPLCSSPESSIGRALNNEELNVTRTRETLEPKSCPASTHNRSLDGAPYLASPVPSIQPFVEPIASISMQLPPNIQKLAQLQPVAFGAPATSSELSAQVPSSRVATNFAAAAIPANTAPCSKLSRLPPVIAGAPRLPLPATVAMHKSQVATGSTALATTDVSPSSPGGFAVGDSVEYFSSSAGTWISARVLAINPRGTYNLDCKPDVLPSKMRLCWGRPGLSLRGTFGVGEAVEYYSNTHGGWIATKVVTACPNGNFNLECKPDVPCAKMRARSAGYR